MILASRCSVLAGKLLRGKKKPQQRFKPWWGEPWRNASLQKKRAM
jgi:hypothetical protein